MSYELVISSKNEVSRIALLKNKSLVEYQVEEGNASFQVGDIYLGQIRKVSSGLNAAFVDVGHDKDGFLHYQDLGPQVLSLNKLLKLALTKANTPSKLDKFKFESEIEKFGKMSQVFSKNRKALVQVLKEPISTKGPRLTCEISIAGRYMVLVPFSKAISISKKISNSEERKRLTRLISSIKPNNFGVIVRTVAEGKDVAELDKDLKNSLKKWSQGIKALKSAKPTDRIIGESSRTTTIIRDMLNESFDSIIVDNDEMYDEIMAYIETIAPEKIKMVKKHTGRAKIFETYGIEKQLKMLFGRSVSIQGGGYLIIEHTEAMHVIDVNSGNKSNSEADQEATAIIVNLAAAREVARQLKLRDMGGIIVVDFIDMKKAENKKKLLQVMREEMKTDRSKATILPLSRFGLMQITRQRVRPELNMTTQENCPTCEGTGKITASIGIAEVIEHQLDLLMSHQNKPSLKLVLHPYLYAYFTAGFISKRMQWYKKYLKWVEIVKDSSKALTEFAFLDKNGEKIDL